MNIDASFKNIRFNLNYTLRKKEEYKNELLSFGEENYGFFLVRIATECMLLLDQVMEIVWKKVADLENKMPYAKFPFADDEDTFICIIKKRMKIENLQDDFPDFFKLIIDVQPFVCGESWFFYQYHIANERHSDPQLVYEYRPNGAVYITMPDNVGEEVKAFITAENGDKHFVHIRRYDVPDRKSPKVIIKSKEEAINFIENCIYGTNKLICDMIDCFERRL